MNYCASNQEIDRIGDKIRCTCVKFQTPKDIRLHLVTKGFVKLYNQWVCHGEMNDIGCSSRRPVVQPQEPQRDERVGDYVHMGSKFADRVINDGLEDQTDWLVRKFISHSTKMFLLYGSDFIFFLIPHRRLEMACAWTIHRRTCVGTEKIMTRSA